MDLVLYRDPSDDVCTIGRLFVNGGLECFVLEPPVRAVKIPGVTAIPAGRYRVIVTWSNRFQRNLPLLVDVPDFAGIRIHAGNKAIDTAGCLCVGLTREHDSILSSALALASLQPKIAGAEARGDVVWIQIFPMP